MKRTFWSPLDIELLRQYYPISTDSELINQFPNRTLVAIKVKAKKLHILKNKEAETKNRSAATSGTKNGMFGKKSHVHGQTYESFYGQNKSDAIKQKIREKAIGRIGLSGEKNGMFGKPSYHRGIPQSDEVKKKLSDKQKEKWKNLSPNEREKKLMQLMQMRLNQINGAFNRDTKPEIICEKYIKDKNWEYDKKVQVGYYNCDFIIHKQYVVEVQGDYWHANPKFYSNENWSVTQRNNVHRDRSKLTYLRNKGYSVLYLWEDDINKNFTFCCEQLNKFIDGSNI